MTRRLSRALSASALRSLLVEIRRFLLVAGTDQSEFLAADHRMNTEFLYLQKGFVRGTTARDAEGRWLSLLFWGDQHCADEARMRAGNDPVALSFESLIDSSSAQLDRFETLD